ncbi:unnamed protein product [Coffea canephora]|uniref:non-specific serine/threonine protein kinase n=1 Tax=Coffea canephora TaxID=49390 RepID=A0A068U2C3_COFCA|nr:unnamed protein product [Coffea canephora]
MGLFLTARISKAFIFLCCLLAISEADKLKTFSEQYGNTFNQTDSEYFMVEAPAMISNGALQVTPDSLSDDFSKANKSGRILLKQSFKLWKDGDDAPSNETRVASFNSSFLVNLYPVNNSSGEGLTFLIAPGLDLPPPNSFGQFLGLTNATTDGNSSNKIVAVELDTFKQDFDPDNNHVGLDINGVRSNISASLTPHGITLVPPAPNASFHNVWVEYDGVKKIIEVYIAEQEKQNGSTPPHPSSPIIRSHLDLRGVLNQDSYFGFSASTGNTAELNCVLRWNLTIEYYHEENQWQRIVLGAGVPGLVLLLVGVAWLGYYFHKRRVERSKSNILGALKSLPGSPKEYEFKELKKATNSFDEKHKLGQGGYGVVYKGFLTSENLEIAVKWFLRDNIKGQDDFLAELTIINRLRHKHLVKLLGWCHKNGKLLLVYEYMPKGSLDQHLFVGQDKPTLSWNLRYKIVSGAASALHYLHNEYEQRVVHRDLKASNIMLDFNFNARLGDFGLARVLENEKTSYHEAEGIPGTIGYIAPECFHTGTATQQSDVYAFGAVLLEVVCGQRPGTKIAGCNGLAEWVWFLHRDGLLLRAVDEKLGEDYVAEEAERLLLLGLACSHPIASERPKTQAILQIISGSVPPPNVPPFKPAFVWPAMVPVDIDSRTTTGTTTSITNSHFNSEWSQQYLSRESYAGYSDHSMV